MSSSPGNLIQNPGIQISQPPVTLVAFLEKFIEDGMPWVHIDIAGVTTTNSATHMAPKGATGWGVAALDELVRSRET